MGERRLHGSAAAAIAAIGLACAPPPTTPPSSAATTPAVAPQIQGPQHSPLVLPDFFAEGLAWDPLGSRVLVGGIVAQAIVAGPLEGAAPQRFAAPAQGWSVFGVAVDPERKLVWAACAAVTQGRVLPGELGRAGLFAFALADGALVHERLTPAGDGVGHLFGDLALVDDGRVFVTDTQGGGVFWTSADEPSLRVVVPAGTFRSVQGVVAIEPQTLVVADYSTGLVRVRLDATHTATELTVLPPPAGEDLRGIDGLAHRGRTIAAAQNGATPHRILRVGLADDLGSITGVEVLHSIPVTEGEPTLATVVGDELWVMQTDRWDRVFDGKGRPKDGVAIASPVILRLPFGG